VTSSTLSINPLRLLSAVLTIAYLCVFFCVPVVGQESQIALTTISGETVQGRAASIEFEEVAIDSDGQIRKFGFDQISKIDFGLAAHRPPEPVTKIYLLDGSILNAKSFNLKSSEFSGKLSNGSSAKFNSRNIESIRFKTYENELDLAKQWRTIVADDSREGDAIVVNRAGELDTVEGIAGDFTDEKLTFSIDDRTARVPQSKMEAVMLYHASGREFGTPICELVLTDESRFKLKKLSWVAGRMTGQTACGAALEFSLDHISRLDFSLGRDVLLSDLEPTTNDWQPLMTSSAIVEKLRRMKLARKNESFSNQPLSLKFFTDTGLAYLASVKQFEHGFAMQSGGKLAFALNGQYEKLSGAVGFDPNANASGNVRLVISLDGKIVLEKEMIHRTMKNPIQLDLLVKDISRVVFQVEYNDGRSTGDQIHLVDLKVSQ
jgi:hypothetical protein